MPAVLRIVIRAGSHAHNLVVRVGGILRERDQIF